MATITELATLEQKKTDSLELYKPLNSYIAKQYGNHVAKEYENALQNLQQKRTEIRNLQDKSEGSRDACLKYAAELSFVDKHFPVNSGADRIALTFPWYDVFSRKKVSQGNIFYEQANAVFNAAVIESQIGVAENRTSDEGLKNATKAFQNAAGLFAYIKEKIAVKIVERITTDLTGESLESLSLLMLANAQQCVVEKADKGKMKPNLLSKLAASASAMFAQTAKLMSANSEILDKNFRDYAGFKTLYFDALANYYMAVDHHSKDEIGQELARIKKALSLMEESKKYRISNALKNSAKTFVDELNKNFQIADNENQKIYHERVPDPSTLPEIEQKSLAKLTQVDDITTYVKVVDSFERLYPIRVMEAKQKYTEQLNAKLQTALRAAREHRDKIKQSLAQMGLPGSILAVEQKTGFPEQVHQRIAKINSSGGMSRITELKTNVDEMADVTNNSCAALKKLLDEEQEDDEQCRQQFTSRWARHPSSSLTVNFRKQLDDFNTKVQLAKKSDSIINNKIQQYGNLFMRFTLQKNELDKLLPSANLENGNDTLSKSYIDLKQGLGQLDQMFGQEDAIEMEIKQIQQQENVESSLLQNQENIEGAIQQELSKYDAKLKELLLLGQNEDNLMSSITTANQAFVQHKAHNKATEQKERAIQEMYEAMNKYDEILANLKEGIQFYSSMQDILKKHERRIQDFVFARKTEKQDLITNIQYQLTNVNLQGSSYQPQQQSYYVPPAGSQPQYAQVPPQYQQYPQYQASQQAPQQRPPPPQYQQYQPQGYQQYTYKK